MRFPSNLENREIPQSLFEKLEPLIRLTPSPPPIDSCWPIVVFESAERSFGMFLRDRAISHESIPSPETSFSLLRYTPPPRTMYGQQESVDDLVWSFDGDSQTDETNNFLYWASGVLAVHWQGSTVYLLALSYSDGRTFAISAAPSAIESLRTAFLAWKRKKALSGKLWTIKGNSLVSSDWENDPRVNMTMNDVFMAPALKRDILHCCDAVFLGKLKKQFDRLNTPLKRGMIFKGPPGCGKTMTPALLARMYGVPLVYIAKKPSSDSYDRGTSFSSIYDTARTLAPCFVVFEELDKLLTFDPSELDPEDRPSGESRGFIRDDQVNLGDFLTAVDGVEGNNAIITIATTNNVRALPRSVRLRPSRFDRIFDFPNPDEAMRRHYLNSKIALLMAGDDGEASLSLGQEGLKGASQISAAVDYVVGNTFDYPYSMLQEIVTTSLHLTETIAADLPDEQAVMAEALRRASDVVLGSFADKPSLP